MESLDRWVERQYRHSADAMLLSVSPVHIVKTRPGFGQTVVPRKGSVVASPVLGAYDPDPDYFFHWYRDSAIVIDALRLLGQDAALEVDARGHFSDFVHFSLSLLELDGRALTGAGAAHGADAGSWRAGVLPEYEKYLRTDADLAAVHGEATAAETRVNPDGSLDISSWPRPQHDGPAMRALCLMRWLESVDLSTELRTATAALLRADLGYTRHRWRQSCYDIWEEERGLHYYTLRVAAAALDTGAAWFTRWEDGTEAAAAQADAAAILALLDGYWREDVQFYRSRVLDSRVASAKELDISVILAAIHAGGTGAAHSVHDLRMHATLMSLEALFDAEYPINRNRPGACAPAMGRYAADVYFSGGAYYFSTLAAAEFCYRAGLFRRGDAFLETVRAYTPPNGELSEQFDQRTGAQRSARQLAWSHAALISCVTARRLEERDRQASSASAAAGDLRHGNGRASS